MQNQICMFKKIDEICFEYVIYTEIFRITRKYSQFNHRSDGSILSRLAAIFILPLICKVKFGVWEMETGSWGGNRIGGIIYLNFLVFE